MLDSTRGTPARRGSRFPVWSAVLATLVILLNFQVFDSSGPGIVVDHLPSTFSYRTGDVTANISGRVLSPVSEIRYRVNGDEWHVTRQEGPRVHKPLFCVEMDPGELRAGRNTVQISALSRFGGVTNFSHDFDYSPAPIRLPVDVKWSSRGDLDVESGIWETVAGEDGPRLRPRPGFEDYDRIVVAVGPFAGGRRVTTDVIFRSFKSDKQAYGFGLLPLWGGRPEANGYTPRRGWNFSIAWYYSHYGGVGEEFSFKKGSESAEWVSSYRNFDLQAGVRYTIVAEAREVLAENGKHRKYYQRMRWGEGSEAGTPWIELADDEGVQIPPGEYAVAIVAHRCQVEFGPVRVEPLAPDLEATAK